LPLAPHPFAPGALTWWHRLFGNMAVHPLHRIGGDERQCAREHFVERDAERVEVAARINRTVHASGLFRRHVGERASDELGRRGRLPLALQPGGEAEPGQPDPSVRAVHQEMGGLQVPVHKAACMELAEGRGDADGQGQEAAHRHGGAQQPHERLAARILEHQSVGSAFALKRQGLRRPRPVQRVFQAVFVGQAIEATQARTLRGRHHNQHGLPLAVIRLTPGSAEVALTVRPQDLEAAIPFCAKTRG